MIDGKKKNRRTIESIQLRSYGEILGQTILTELRVVLMMVMVLVCGLQISCRIIVQMLAWKGDLP